MDDLPLSLLIIIFVAEGLCEGCKWRHPRNHSPSEGEIRLYLLHRKHNGGENHHEGCSRIPDPSHSRVGGEKVSLLYLLTLYK